MSTNQKMAMKHLARERKFGSHRNKVAAKRAMSLDMLPVEALALFRASISDYSRFGLAADVSAQPITFPGEEAAP